MLFGGDHYFPNKLDDYLVNQDDPVALAGATEFYYLISGSESVDNKLPENKFLKKFKFVDEDLRLIDKEGKLIDSQGRHIDEKGNLIKWNSDGTSGKVDPSGRPVGADGDFDVEHMAFLDDDGELIKCSTHGALFNIEEGLCLLGPCKGKRLQKVPFFIENGMLSIKESCLIPPLQY